MSSSARASTPQTEMAAVIDLLQTIVQAGSEAQARLSQILLESSFVPVPSFVAGVPRTPSELATATPEDEDIKHYWVVLRGREPGLYRNPDAARLQTNGVPNSCQSRKAGRSEALAFYAANYPAQVKKWVEVEAPVPVAESSDGSAPVPTDLDATVPADSQ